MAINKNMSIINNIAAITGGANVPSARFRVQQYIEPLKAKGIKLTELKTITSAYPPMSKIMRVPWGGTRMLEMINAVIKSRFYDATLLQREMISMYETLEGWTGTPRIFDVDDSIHLYRNGIAAKSIASKCDRIICGNNFLADFYMKYNKNVVVLPTGIDTDKFAARTNSNNEDVVIGWIGSSANLPYLESIEREINVVLNKFDNVKIYVVSDQPPAFNLINKSKLFFKPWMASSEVADTQSFDIGLMPLGDTLWARGKCSFKMLQYMSCEIPVVVSPVGMNSEILNKGNVGRGAAKSTEWVDHLVDLIENPALRIQLGINGRNVVLENYAVSKLTNFYSEYLTV